MSRITLTIWTTNGSSVPYIWPNINDKRAMHLVDQIEDYLHNPNSLPFISYASDRIVIKHIVSFNLKEEDTNE